MAQAKGLKQILTKQPSDVVLLSSLRTPVTRAVKGGFRDAYDHELLSHILKATLAANPNLDPAKIDDVAVGVVLAELGGSKAARMAQLHAGFHERTALHTINRACSSGLAAVTSIANMISVGQINVGIGAGMESMTKNYGSKAIPTALWDELKNSPVENARDCIMPMGLTSENVAKRYGVNREDQDAFAAESHKRASKAQKSGLFDSEIVPVKVRQYVPEQPDVAPNEVVVDKDDGIRHDASLEKMAKLKPAFSKDGSSTAGNSSQISDGAAATLLMRRSTANELGLSKSIIGKWAGTQVAGCRPDEMGIGPAIAIPKLLDYTGLKTDDVNVWEINEAFASQALYCIRKLGLDVEKVNPRGGAIALGHPLGMTGTRQLATLMPQLQEGQVGVVSMCIGTGMGMAGLFVRE
ncbi:3-ketoacyl-CoA thiolase, peroxisomal [Exophiala dermatitidis]|uniref:acetyl-CoA C-acyltransferase n=1 Tax=Exophiala dermatitidis (strain ATCC 34100 / CBS 525.76 / NIH/UT8656) TaxID=858893 RepID=H6C520_EXODN|nr:acetyl-CoA acyltransferase [Exophiala dermatitidis NIH/UT8656]EHY58921.1 acetyl-CoA acyltransferase [Exophiala dermatitidis NIH/UT8656]